MSTQQERVMEHWDWLKGKILERWGELTEDELLEVEGQLDQLVSLIQQKTGEARQHIKRVLNDLSDEYGDAFTRAKESARQYAGRAREGYDEAQEIVRRRPAESVAVAFGTELALKYGRDHDIEGVILLSPPLHRATADDVAAWAGDARRMIVLVPEFDDYLRPDEARERFASVPDATLIAVEGGKHLWVGETQTRRVLTEIVAAVNPDALPLPTEWDGDVVG